MKEQQANSRERKPSYRRPESSSSRETKDGSYQRNYGASGEQAEYDRQKIARLNKRSLFSLKQKHESWRHGIILTIKTILVVVKIKAACARLDVGVRRKRLQSLRYERRIAKRAA